MIDMDKLDIIIEKLSAIAEFCEHLEKKYEEMVTVQQQQTEQAEQKEQKKIGLETSIRELHIQGILGSRATNCLIAVGIETVEDITRVNKFSLFKIRNFGKKSYMEIDRLLADNGLTWGKEDLVREDFRLCLPKKK